MKEESPQMQLRFSTTKQRENKSKMCSSIQKQAQDILEIPFSPRNVKYTHVTPTKKQGKLPKMRGKMKEKQHNPEIFREDFIPVETLLKESHEDNKRKKRKWNQSIGMPNKTNRKIRITNQLRLNSKALFKPALNFPPGKKWLSIH
jgi:hypothetical protein